MREFLNVIAGLAVWSYIIHLVLGFNELFTDRPWMLLFIEVGIILTIILIIWLISRAIKRYKETHCKHKMLRSECVICLEEQRKVEVKALEIKRRAEIENKARKLNHDEGLRLENLRYQKSSKLLELTPNEFEDAIAKLFRKMGYSVTQTPYVNDGGKDAIAIKDGEKFLIECKRYATNKTIGRPMLQKFHSAMVEENAIMGFFVTTAKFTDTSYEYAEKYNIELIDGEILTDLFRELFPKADEQNTYKQMCLECGLILEFNQYEGPHEKLCERGHPVKKMIPYNPIHNYYRPKKKYKRRRRYY